MATGEILFLKSLITRVTDGSISCIPHYNSPGTSHKIHETCRFVTFYFKKNLFSGISRKCIRPNMIRMGTALIIFGEMHFLLIPQNEFSHEIKCNRMTSITEFMSTGQVPE